jgi:dTDP-4-amino-4,6-dideoxygalactose transaminase
LSKASASVARISNLDAGVALVQLRRLATIQKAKIEVAEMFQRELEGNRLIGFPQYAPGRYLARIMLLLPEKMDIAAVRSFLTIRGIGTRLGYPMSFAAAHTTRNAEAWSRRLLGIPCGVGIGEADVKRICLALNEALRTLSP